MTQIKEKTGICKSVVIATVIRGVVKNGFHCTYSIALGVSGVFCLLGAWVYFSSGVPLHMYHKYVSTHVCHVASSNRCEKHGVTD